MKRTIAWIPNELGAAIVLVDIAGFPTSFDSKGFRSLVFAAFLLLATGWIVGGG